MDTENTPQPLPMAAQQDCKGKEEPKDPAQTDYEEGVEFLKNKSHAQAANCFHNAMVGFDQKGDKKGMANAADKLGDICLERQEFEKALDYFEKPFSVCMEFNDVFSLLALRKKMALCHTELKQSSEAINHYLDLLDLYEQMHNPASSVDVLVKIAEIYYGDKNLQGAIDAYKTASAIHTNFKHRNHAQKLMDKAEEIEKELASS